MPQRCGNATLKKKSRICGKALRAFTTRETGNSAKDWVIRRRRKSVSPNDYQGMSASTDKGIVYSAYENMKGFTVMNYKGQTFGNREVIENKCVESDWTRLGMKVPSRLDKYVLTKCLNCNTVLPCMIRNLHHCPPKRCVMCSNIGNHSNIKTNTNAWALYDDCAVCNVVYGNDVISFYIDRSNYNLISQYVWRISKKRRKYYVITGSYKKGTMRYLHEVVWGQPLYGMEIDHIDGNSLNNRHENLRLVSRQENIDNQRATRIDNQIGIRGVAYCKRNNTYKVDFNYHGQRFYTKDWTSIEEAVWCRYCFEDYYGIPAIKSNPLAEQYYTLDDNSKDKIRQYVLEKILGNERY